MDVCGHLCAYLSSTQGELVAFGDTGIDHDMCFFHDPDHGIPLNTVNREHRKIVNYVTFPPEGRPTSARGTGGDTDGHGTHVAGSLAAKVQSSHAAAMEALSPWNGMAPEAKLVVFDFLYEGAADIWIPDDISDQFYSPAYNVGVRTCSNSWGDDSGVYDSFALETDTFAYNHPDFLFVFAGGNSGDNGMMTLATPGVAKNAITAGSCMNDPQSFFDQGYGSGIEVDEPARLRGTYAATPADFGTPFHLAPVMNHVRVVVADPYDMCTELVNKDEVRGNVVLGVRGPCYFSVKAQNAQEAGASAFICVNSEAGPAISMSGEVDVSLPSVMVSQSDGQHLKNEAESGTLRITLPVAYVNEDESEKRLSSFSSRGPTFDGRFKPDVLTPGEYIVSAKSDRNVNTHQCDSNPDVMTTPMQGTSMATPILAGAAMLVRQYFREGRYVAPGQGSATTTPQPFIPPAALTKAVLVHSGVTIGGKVYGEEGHPRAEFDVTPTPSLFQGFGRVKLDDVLLFATDQPASHSLYVAHTDSVTTGVTQRYCFQVPGTDSVAFRATLVWSDPPSDPASDILLVNDLDLSVAHVGTGQTWIGNRYGHWGQQLGTEWDAVNNVEQVREKDGAGSVLLLLLLPLLLFFVFVPLFSLHATEPAQKASTPTSHPA